MRHIKTVKWIPIKISNFGDKGGFISEITLTASALNFSAPPSDTLPDKKADAGRGIEEGSIYFLALLIYRNLSLTEREGMTASLFPRIISGERSGKNRAHIRRWKIVKFQNECFNLVSQIPRKKLRVQGHRKLR